MWKTSRTPGPPPAADFKERSRSRGRQACGFRGCGFPDGEESSTGGGGVKGGIDDPFLLLRPYSGRGASSSRIWSALATALPSKWLLKKTKSSRQFSDILRSPGTQEDSSSPE